MDVHEVLAVVVSSRRSNEIDRPSDSCGAQLLHDAPAMPSPPPSPQPTPLPSPSPYFSSPFARASMDMGSRPLPIPRASLDGPQPISAAAGAGGTAAGQSISLSRLLSGSIFAGSLSRNDTSSVSPSVSPHSPMAFGHATSVPVEFGWLGDKEDKDVGSAPVRDMMAKQAGIAAGGLLSRSLADRRADRRATEAAAQAAVSVPRVIAVFDDTWGIHHPDIDRRSN